MAKDPTAAEAIGDDKSRRAGWSAGAVGPPKDPRLQLALRDLMLRFPVARTHHEALQALGSQIVHAAPCRVKQMQSAEVCLVRFSGAIETAFGLTREVLLFYSPHPDLQFRDLQAAQQSLRHFNREVTSDVIAFWSPDPRAATKLADWSTPDFLVVPLPVEDVQSPVEIVAALKDRLLTRDLFYETTPVTGNKFFGRRSLLQELRDDIAAQRVAGIFGLRKAGKTSVLTEVGDMVKSANQIFILRDLETLPSPPTDPIPELVADIVSQVADELEERQIVASPLPRDFKTLGDFRRLMQATLKTLSNRGVRMVLTLDEVEYLTPPAKIDVREGDLPSIAQFLSVLRSLVQENGNFTFLLAGLTSSIVQEGRLYGRPNPLFSWAKQYYVSPFRRDEADELATSVGNRMGVHFDPGALEALHEATGGHAYLYRNLASHVVGQIPMEDMKRQMTRSHVLSALEDWRFQVAGNIDEMLDHVQRYYPDESFLLEMLSSSFDEFQFFASEMPTELGHLLSLGLVERLDDGFAPSALLQLR